MKLFATFVTTITFVIFLISARPVNAATYFVSSSSGSDSNSGVSEQSPWKSLEKVNSFSLQPGDIVQFQRGDNWTGSLTPTQSGTSNAFITFGAYGSDTKPLPHISAAVPIAMKDLQSEGASKWSYTLSKEPKILIFNEKELGSLTSIDALSKPFEWAIANNRVYIFSEQVPDTFYTSIKIGTFDAAFSSNNQKYLLVENILFSGGSGGTVAETGGCVNISPNTSYVTIRNSKIMNCYGQGIRITGSEHITILNSAIKNIVRNGNGTLGDGVLVNWQRSEAKSPSDITLVGNIIEGIIERQGIAVTDGKKITIAENTIFSGNIGIDLEPSPVSEQSITDVVIRKNTIDKGEPTTIFSPKGIASFGEKISLVKISENHVNLQSSSNSMGILVSGQPGTLIEHNFISNAQVGIRIGPGAVNTDVLANHITANSEKIVSAISLEPNGPSTIRFNFIEGNWLYAILSASSSNTTSIFNNTLMGYQNGYVSANGTNPHDRINNTIFYSQNANVHLKIDQSETLAISSDYNSYYPFTGELFKYRDTRHTLTDWQRTLQLDTHSIGGDPLFSEQSLPTLLPNSQLIDRGVDIEKQFDFLRNPTPVGDGVDIGATEFQGANTTHKTGDIDGDNDVDIYDFTILLENFGKTGPPGFILADIIKNGAVDIADYNALISNFGK